MKRILYIGLIGLFGLISPHVAAQSVNEEAAQLVAKDFWDNHRPDNVKPATMLTLLPFSELEHLHIFDVDGQGFVIVAGDQRVSPILAYSFDSPATKDLNPETAYWLRGYEAQISELPELSESSELPGASKSSGPSKSTAVSPLMTTRWDQSPYYNHFCPYDSVSGARTVVGCVATAMAQIMRYWSYPAYGQGSHSYNYRHYGVLSADFENTSYLWHIMPNTCNEFSQESEVNATAILSYHCGVGVEMEYGTTAEGGSGAYSECNPWVTHCAVSTFVDYFKYDPDISFASRDGMADSAWLEILDNELSHRRPVYYHGRDESGGHAFVLDGSDLDGRYHINWGWGGSYDGFYYVDTLSPHRGGTGGNSTYTFNLGQGIIYNIKPAMEEVFDTVDYLDSVCENTQYVYFRNYKLLVFNVRDRDTLLHNFDTVFRYHLKVIQKKKVYLNPNNGGVSEMRNYCPASGYTLPECTFSKPNCIFTGWCRNRDGNDVIHQPGETLFFNNSPTFFAIWNDTTAVGIDNISDSKTQVSISPNPTTGEITISTQASLPAIGITVYDALGRLVLRDDSLNTIGGKAKISLQQLPNGIYTIMVKTVTGIHKQQVIKQ